MKKIVVLVCLCAFAGLFACAKSGDAEAKATMMAMAKLNESTADKLDKAASGKEAGDALIAYGGEMKVLMLKSKELTTKYPELAKAGTENSDKFKAETEALKISMGKFTKSMTAATVKYAGTKEMLEAAKKMGEIMKDVK
jgi:hypothetical protein